ncbi:WD repeat protein [Schizosaccharomyces pombe]|uniref:GID complex subunit 7 n=1 Tax=Schizosaccharomyces pombe (strain 972 / ATCC 24843) TaxID=284812 RepID=GID7_SCHPO|nr:WD repeat-containing protein [Schizosaccharomyces pombe]Q9UT85.1 RecName: Full=Uncharacterized WD repeat-containing protein C343.04c [Schizosaccharomyces pombe 972h-]CAB52267.1 WD repeat protein, human WDR26 family, ubiquitin ligase complex subunit (predicted) [Schizosaccharomyces pombe]|eukprot:NP_593424.1 WD repeat-containing protein [Schizosaccharomyces pombe]
MALDEKFQLEVIHLLLQFLNDYGYDESLKALEKETGLVSETEDVKRLKQAVLQGDWITAEAAFSIMQLRDESKRKEAQFLLQKQRCLELARSGAICEAIYVLQNFESTDFNKEKERLVSIILESNNKSNNELITKNGYGNTRLDLLNQLSEYISPEILLPKRRLEHLLQQAKDYQVSSQVYHNVLKNFSFLSDYKADPSELPTKEYHVFHDHSDEVWQISYSHNGRYLASASKDKTAIIFDVVNLKRVFRLIGHIDTVAYIRWSPDDRYLLSCSCDKSVILWDAFTGEKLRDYKHGFSVSCCCWLPDGLSFITGSPDCHITHWSLNGEILYKWEDVNIYDMALTSDGTKLYIVGFEQLINAEDKHIAIYSVETRECIKKISLQSKVTSICLSKDSKYALTNLEPHTTFLWDLEENRIVRQYMGHKLGNFLIGSCFGGKDDTFVLSGSEDDKIRIWHRESGKLLATLSGHVKCVNYVAYNPVDPYQFASAGDDNTVRIWSNKDNPRRQ